MNLVRRVSEVVVVVCAALATLGAAGHSTIQEHTVAHDAFIDRFLAPERDPLVSYRALRRMTASTRGGRTKGMIEAWTTLDPLKGFSYEIVSEEGSSIIRKRV